MSTSMTLLSIPLFESSHTLSGRSCRLEGTQ